ncbi:non-ribosomal peptide synthetase, partial [Microtetraspora fusca]|uniref:non-ribosomal peptide synthetase n=1 Tax=Microtetraspora fusca TaxID=1997 RepID=UPI000AAA1906
MAGVRCLHELIAQQAELRPQAVAATCAGAEMTYGELDRRARELAARLRALGAGPESMVGVCLNRSLDVPVALLAVLYAGAAYLPLEPDYPEERLAYMIEDSGAKVVVTDDECAPRLPAGLRLVRAGEGAGAGSAAGTGGADLAGRGDPDSLAYVIYTSGSTGRPKGVAVSHRAVARRVKDPAWLPLREHEVFLFTTPLSFDVSVLEVFGCLTNGHTLAILPAGKALPERVAAFLAAEPVTVTWLTAALFHAVVDCAERPFPTVRWLIAGGDQLSADHVERARALVPNGRVMNGYGPTECTIFTTTHPVPDDHAGRVPIGEALPYTRAHIVDRNLYPVPDGVAGELLVGGEGLARGYLHRPGLTAERFVPNPLARTPGERLYRTGDLVRRRSDGPIEFLGRSDHQVKIRGFRVELEEAEQVLRRHPAVRDVVVTAPAHEGDRRLVAYVVPEGRWPGSSELLRHAREALPDYMVPALFVTLDALPVSPNGKVDRAALPEPEAVRPDLDGAYVPPRDPIEQTLAGLWTTLLGLDRIGVNDHFFDIGGHSLLASRLLARVRRAFGRDVPLADFLATPTIAGLAELVQSRLLAPGGPSRPPIARAVHGDSLPASLG